MTNFFDRHGLSPWLGCYCLIELDREWGIGARGYWLGEYTLLNIRQLTWALAKKKTFRECFKTFYPPKPPSLLSANPTYDKKRCIIIVLGKILVRTGTRKLYVTI